MLRKLLHRVLATFIFFTRLPFWRIAEVDKRHYEHVVPLWPLAGWLTGGVLALVAWGAMSLGLPASVSVVLALLARILVTGALHEDGLADFCDGFGGGTTRERTLAIMKDSHIGTYGVLGLVGYFFLLWTMLTSLLDAGLSPLVLLAVDAFSKWLSSSIVVFLPYARSASEAKNRLVYSRPSVGELLIGVLLGCLPWVAVWLLVPESAPLLYSACLPIVGCVLLFLWMHRRLGGYTGDCCGATFLLTETLFYLSLCLLLF